MKKVEVITAYRNDSFQKEINEFLKLIYTQTYIEKINGESFAWHRYTYIDMKISCAEDRLCAVIIYEDNKEDDNN